MGLDMASDSNDMADLLQRATSGDEQATRELFGMHRDRLKRMVHTRLSRRLQGREFLNDQVQRILEDLLKCLQVLCPGSAVDDTMVA